MIRPWLLLAAAFFAVLPASGVPEHFFVGTYTGISTSKGIYAGTLDSDTGKLGPMVLAATSIDASFLALAKTGRFLYAAREGDAETSCVTAYAVGRNGSLALINRQPSGGAGTCHLSLDTTGRILFAANYAGGTIACFPIGADGSIGPASCRVQFHGSGPNQLRQTGPHAHSIYVSPDDAFVYACDLGSDCIWIFRFDPAKGALAPAQPAFARVEPGYGPRHLVFSQDGRLVYVLSELGSAVTIFTRDAKSGALTRGETVSCLPPGVSRGPTVGAAEIALDSSGRRLDVSVRGPDVMTVLSAGNPGPVHVIQMISAGVKIPRHFAIDPSGRWLITAGQVDNRLAVLKIDPASGQLSPAGESASVGAPVCVLFDPAIR